MEFFNSKEKVNCWCLAAFSNFMSSFFSIGNYDNGEVRNCDITPDGSCVNNGHSNYDKCEDRISELPDDILLRLVSPLGMKEAAQNSVISKRWKYLWAMRTHLDFDHLILLPGSDPNPRLCYHLDPKSKGEYIKWVDQVVDFNCSPFIDTFRVCFEFNSGDAQYIDKWLRFALSKKVKNLELDFWFIHSYSIEFDILKPSSLLESGISFLTSLDLNCVNVSGDFLEYVLSQCCFLERLCVQLSQTLVSLKVAGLSLKLKHLTIGKCPKMKELEIDAVNLIYFKYQGSDPNTELVLTSMPLLVEAVFDGINKKCSFPISQQISQLASHISKLSINLMYYTVPAGVLPTFYNVKQLSLRIKGEYGFDPVGITDLLKAFPVLHDLELQFSWFLCNHIPSFEDAGLVWFAWIDVCDGNMYYLECLEWWETHQNTLPNLKTLRVAGFSGSEADVNFILHILVCACNLNTIICDTTPSEDDSPTEEEIEDYRCRAHQLAKFISPKISVLVN